LIVVEHTSSQVRYTLGLSKTRNLNGIIEKPLPRLLQETLP